MNILTNEKAKLIIGGSQWTQEQGCWGQHTGKKTPDGKCIVDVFCAPTDKYGNRNYNATKKVGTEYHSCS